MPIVGSRYVFFLCPEIIEGRDIHIKGDIDSQVRMNWRYRASHQ